MKLGCHMLLWRVLLSDLSVEVLTVRATWCSVVVPEQTSFSQLRKQELNDVLERLGEQNICLSYVSEVARRDSNHDTHKIEAINVRLLDPGLEAIGNLLGCTDEDGTVAANTNMLGNGMLGPLRVVRRESGVCVHS